MKKWLSFLLMVVLMATLLCASSVNQFNIIYGNFKALFISANYFLEYTFKWEKITEILRHVDAEKYERDYYKLRDYEELLGKLTNNRKEKFRYYFASGAVDSMEAILYFRINIDQLTVEELKSLVAEFPLITSSREIFINGDD